MTHELQARPDLRPRLRITWAEGRWHDGPEAQYSLDGLNRLTGAQRGDRSGGSLNLENFHQEWTLDQTGNWDLFKNDLNGDGDWSDSDEVQDNRTHNVVNEITGRDTNNSSPDEFTPLYTPAGQLSDDDQHYKYTYDAWGRLVKITNQSNATTTEYEYNGLGHRIGHRWDVDADTDLDWEWLAYDDKWRVIARFADSSVVTEPKEQIYHHAAGLNGHGGSSYIDLVIARDQFDYSEDVPVAVRDYVLQNWRADVVALAAPDGDLRERVTYDAYGVPFATHPTDLTTGTTAGIAGYGCPNGVVDSSDYSYFLTLYGASDWRADWNRDGTLSTADNTAFVADHGAAAGSWGRGVLSNRGSILGYAGYMHEPATGSAGGGQGTMWHVRKRILHAGLGTWLTRDPLQYLAGVNLYNAVMSNPIVLTDPMGEVPQFLLGCALGAVWDGAVEGISCWWYGESDCGCRAGCAAAAGCLRGGIGLQFPGLGTCLANALAPVANQLCQCYLCDTPPPPVLPNPNGPNGGNNGCLNPCFALAAAINALTGCIGAGTTADVKALLGLLGLNTTLGEYNCNGIVGVLYWNL